MVDESKLQEFICKVNDPDGRLTAVLERLAFGVKRVGRFALAIGGTEMSDVEGISAAGASGEARRITPAVDAEALVLGRPLSAESIPVSPIGIVSPVVASRAMVNLLDCKVQVYDCGTFVAPQMECLKVGSQPARRLDSGAAMDPAAVHALFRNGQDVGKKLAEVASYIVIGECVPAGTTTAMGVLTALGYPAHELVSSSMPSSDHHDARTLMVQKGLQKAKMPSAQSQREPLDAVAAVGDPMQPFAAGLALEASKYVPVVLGGGTQMLAVYAIASHLVGSKEMLERALCVITTKWVAFDRFSDPARLARLIHAPFAASCPDFNTSRHEGLRAYECGNVKEGVGAGAVMALAHLAGFSSQRICESIDLQYDRMVLANHTH